MLRASGETWGGDGKTPPPTSIGVGELCYFLVLHSIGKRYIWNTAGSKTRVKRSDGVQSFSFGTPKPEGLDSRLLDFFR